MFCQRGGALEGLVGPCEAGARTAQAPAQEAGSSTAEEINGRNGYAYLHLTVEYDDVRAFLPPSLLCLEFR